MSVSVLPGRRLDPTDGGQGVEFRPPEPLAQRPSCSSDEANASTSLISTTTTTPMSIVEEVESRRTRSDVGKQPTCRSSSRQRRCYSSSESECIQSTSTAPDTSFIARKRNHQQQQAQQFHHQRQRNKRRKFHDKHFQSPADPLNNASGGKGKKQLPRVPLVQQPKAPNNTTQFLITDREQRESSEKDITTTNADSSIAEFAQLRPRCFSSACHNSSSSSFLDASAWLLAHSSDSEEEQEEEDEEFNAIYDNVTLERIQGLPREKVNREMLTTQKCNSQLVDKVTHLKSENHRLKNILQQHGIEFSKSTVQDPPLFDPSKILMKQSTSRSSMESETSKQNEECEQAGELETSPSLAKEEAR